MTQKTNQIYPFFLSSLYLGLKDLRERIFWEVGQGINIYVDEVVVKNRNTKDIEYDHLKVADELIRRVRESNVFICILGGTSHGSDINIETRPSAVSFFEIELYQAALTEKEIHIFVRDDFCPEPRLKNLLQILKFAFPNWIYQKRLNDFQILECIKNLVNKKQRHMNLWPMRLLRAPINILVQALNNARPQPLLFLYGIFETRSKKPDEKILSSIYKQIGSVRNVENRLSRLWIALRELMAAPYTKINDIEVLKHWNKLLAQWANAGAWYGLHGDTPLGCLAALNSMAYVRQCLKDKFGNQVPPEITVYPGGSLASAKYSIAKRLYVKSDKKIRLNDALNDIQRTIQLPGSSENKLRSIRGSVLIHLGRVTEAINDYEFVLKLREGSNAPEPAAIGQALSNLGFGYIRQGHIFKGLDYCERGVRLLRKGDSSVGALARGLRKLSLAYLVNGKINKAQEARKEYRNIALEFSTFDQL